MGIRVEESPNLIISSQSFEENCSMQYKYFLGSVEHGVHIAFVQQTAHEAIDHPGAMDKKHASLDHALVYTTGTSRKSPFQS